MHFAKSMMNLMSNPNLLNFEEAALKIFCTLSAKFSMMFLTTSASEPFRAPLSEHPGGHLKETGLFSAA